MRSRLTMDSLYHVYTQSQDLQDMADVAVELWESQLQSVDAPKRKQKIDKMLQVARQMPHPQFGAFAQAIASTAEARGMRKSKPGQAAKMLPVPVPAVVQRETQMQRLTRNMDLQGIILGGIFEALDLTRAEDEGLWLYAQTRLVTRMQQGGLPAACDALVAGFAKENQGPEVIKQCVDWLNVGAFQGLLAQVLAQLGKVWAKFAEDERAHKAPPPLTVAQAADLYPTRVLLRMLGIAGLRELAAVPPDSPLENALATKLKDFVPRLGSGIANHHIATQLHGLYELYAQHGEKAFADINLTGVQKQAARMYCKVVAFTQRQQKAYMAAAKECLEKEAMARVDRRLKKDPRDAARWIDRARALADYRNDTHGALEALDHVPHDKRDATYARERAIVFGKMGRLKDVLETLDATLAKPGWQDKPSLAKLYCLRAEARLHDHDALGAWADARRATQVAPETPRLAELNEKVLEQLESRWNEALEQGLQEAANEQKFRSELALARTHLLHERWEQAGAIATSKSERSEAADTLGKQISRLASELQSFFDEAKKHPGAQMPEGLTPEMMDLLRQSGWDPNQPDLGSIAEDSDEDG